jgi:hypothetical protein
MDKQRIATISVLALSGIAALVLPFWHYFIVGWRAKRKDIMDGLNAKARMAYFQMFSRSETTPSADSASTQFEQLYSRWYGRRFFIVSGLLLFVVGATAVTLVVLSGLDRLHYLASPLVEVPDTAMAAIAGAYLWVWLGEGRRIANLRQ